MDYQAPSIESGTGAACRVADLKGRVIAVTMPPPWQLLQEHVTWTPDHVHMVTDMDLDTLERLDESLPECDTVVGVGGGSSCDTAKYLAWKRKCTMVLVPTIVSVDAPLTNAVGVRVDKTVQYVGDIWPERVIVDHDLIQRAPKELNRAGAGDIASIHTALYDWQLARDHDGEAYDEQAAELARACLRELDRNAEDIRNVTPRGIDTIVDLYRREVEFCAAIGTSRPEEGSEHLVAYCLEHVTRRHFVHGDLVGLGIFTMSRFQENEHDWVVDLMKRLELRYQCREAEREDVRRCLTGLKAFKDKADLFFSVLDVKEMGREFIDDTLAALYG
ncbi:MAG: iron-containing alcohol dehydrogenase [bacterium]|nr:iron-containing alcohol dehydrogenase [bacterium]